jgi:glyceraldehyde 3-phosphate dehydrogenase
MTTDPRFEAWKSDEVAAEALVPLIGTLYRDFGVVLMLNGQPLVQRSPVELIQAHRRGHTRKGHDLAPADALNAARALVGLALAPVEIDLGKLLVGWESEGKPGSAGAFVAANCANLPRQADRQPREARDVVLYGFGRIGRLLARLLTSKAGGGDKYRLRAIVVRKAADDDLERRANLFRRDSVHGPFKGVVKVRAEESALEINGDLVHFIQASGPDQIDYTAYGIHDAIVIDNTGAWRTREKLAAHLKSAGAAKVILTAPGKGDIPNVVYGVNESAILPDETILSAASCTTNAIVPVLKVLDDAAGVRCGHIETVHAYTNDQNLIDNYHPKTRRGRSAALNLVITETGAASAAAKALPQLKGKLTGSAIRVPVPNVSLAILKLNLDRPMTRDAINDLLHAAATSGPLQAQIGWTAMVDTVSSDLVGDTHGGVVDAEATQVLGDQAVLYVWYDNEYGYSCQVMRMLEYVCGVTRPTFP